MINLRSLTTARYETLRVLPISSFKGDEPEPSIDSANIVAIGHCINIEELEILYMVFGQAFGINLTLARDAIYTGIVVAIFEIYSTAVARNFFDSPNPLFEKN